jgi:hypothetical protein
MKGYRAAARIRHYWCSLELNLTSIDAFGRQVRDALVISSPRWNAPVNKGKLTLFGKCDVIRPAAHASGAVDDCVQFV